jgi:hypothetical protein
VGAGFGFTEIFPVQNNIRTEFLAIAHLYERGEFWHNDGRGYPKQFPLVSERLGVIAR